ncbi:MAG: transcriptional repressor LexA [Candidatus Marinimicrobia bacterium]|nr:transcriptional repressor LexA [Candidatus Neomarinimicrobiota bacterium]
MYLTKKQSSILRFLKEHIAEHGFSPTFDEIAHRFGFKSKGTVYKHINALKTKGAISQEHNRVRGIEIVEDRSENTLPILGVVAAGQPIAAVENPEYIQVPPEFISAGEHYILRVSGESMIDEHIADGDLVVVNRYRTPREGDTVVALIDNSDATIKTLYRRNELVELRPANRALQPQVYSPDRVAVNGVVVGVLRKY